MEIEMILNEIERAVICGKQEYRTNADFIDAIEAAVIAKLSRGVSVEPVYAYEVHAAMCEPELSYTKGGIKSLLVKLYTADQLHTAIAAARVQALDDAADIVDNAVTPDCGGWSTNGIAETVRALKGGAA
jgi:hypothetical protein